MSIQKRSVYHRKVKVHEAHRELLAANEIVTVEKLKNKLAGKVKKDHACFLKYLQIIMNK